MIKEELGQNCTIALNFEPTSLRILKIVSPNRMKWLDWCKKWISDPKKEKTQNRIIDELKVRDNQ